MKFSEVRALFERVERLRGGLEDRGGESFGWDYQFPDGWIQKYVFTGLKNLTEIEDDIHGAFVWAWCLKEYAKEAQRSSGGDPRAVELAIDESHCLSMCVDLGNRLKHPHLRRSRTGSFPRFGKIGFSAPQNAIGQLAELERGLHIHIQDSSCVSITLPVVDQNGKELGDALDLLDQVIDEWGSLLTCLREGAES